MREALSRQHVVERKTILLVMQNGSRNLVAKTLASLAVDSLAVSNCREARAVLRAEASIDVVITQATLADGNWCDILRFLVDFGLHTTAVVSSPHADEHLWSEVLWRGGYDLLVEPYRERTNYARPLRAPCGRHAQRSHVDHFTSLDAPTGLSHFAHSFPTVYLRRLPRYSLRMGSARTLVIREHLYEYLMFGHKSLWFLSVYVSRCTLDPEDEPLSMEQTPC